MGVDGVLSEEDEALIAKAMLLGCKFVQSRTSQVLRYYSDPGAGNDEPFSRDTYIATGYYGWKNPVALARAFVEYKTTGRLPYGVKDRV